MEVKRCPRLVCSVLLVVVLVVCWDGVVGDENLQKECSGDFQKLMGCLSYATGKGNTPTVECCNSVKGIKESDPKCLCFIMQQTHNGSAEIRSLGIQEAKLIQLPSACHLQNTSLSICPKLLGLPANSPDAAIFTNATTAPVTPAASTTTASSDNGSGGHKHRPFLAGSFVIAVLSMSIHAFSMPCHWA